jgi:hypothetical protein
MTPLGYFVDFLGLSFKWGQVWHDLSVFELGRILVKDLGVFIFSGF